MGEKLEQQGYLKKLSNRIEKLKEENHKFIICSMGTANLINKDLVKDYPMAKRGEVLRSLNYQWQMGEITLLGLKGVVSDLALDYTGYKSEERIMKDLKFDIQKHFLCKGIIVPDKFIKKISEQINLRVIGEGQCLYLD